MDAKTIEWIIFGPLILGLLIVSWWATSESHRRLDDPNDDHTVHLDRLREILRLAPHGTYQVTILRQSGNVHSERVVTGAAAEALQVALATLRRAGIDAVHVGENREIGLRVGRLYHDHRGRKEGRKVGKAHIALLERSDPIAPLTSGAPPETSMPVIDPGGSRPETEVHADDAAIRSAPNVTEDEPTVNLRFVGLTCDCGEGFQLPIDDLERERLCLSCGADATLTAAQIAQVHAVVAEAREEALARWRSGERDITIEHRGKLTEATPGLTAWSIHREAALEAVTTLGLLTSGALPVLEKQLRLDSTQHPRALATAHRKEGEQLSREEKKAAGIHANAFMSRSAFDELTERGRGAPLDAHEITLLRASFTVNRHRRVSTPVPPAAASSFVGYRYSTIGRDCPFCSRMDGRVVGPEELAVLPSPECSCPTANYGIDQHYDWLKGVE